MFQENKKISRNDQVAKMQYDEIDEIDLVELVQLIWSKWRVGVGTSVIACMLALVYVTFTPSIYQSWATFFIPSEEASVLTKYASFLGASETGSLEDKVIAIFESERLKISISERVYQVYPELFQEKLKKIELKNKRTLTSPEIMSMVKETLDFRKQLHISKDKSGLFKLYYKNKMPKLSLLIVNASLEEVSKIYNELEIGAKKRIVTVLDVPTLIERPVHPKRALTVILSVLIGGFLGICFAITQDFFKSRK